PKFHVSSLKTKTRLYFTERQEGRKAGKNGRKAERKGRKAGREGRKAGREGRKAPFCPPFLPFCLSAFPSFPPFLSACLPSCLPSSCSEAIAERKLPDPHEPGLGGDAAEARAVGRIRVDAVELRGVRQVEDLEPDLARLVAGEARLFGEHEIDVLAELVARV